MAFCYRPLLIQYTKCDSVVLLDLVIIGVLIEEMSILTLTLIMVIAGNRESKNYPLSKLQRL